MTAACDSPLEVAKERIRIPDLWRELGLEGEPKKTCRCPFHEDRSPSFSIFDDGKGWKCHAGCGGGSIIDFLAKAKGLSDEEACLEILRRAGSNREAVRSERPKREPTVLELPPLAPYSKEIAQSVADSRGLGIAAVEFAALWLKTIVFARVCEQKAWILTDASGKCAEARRIDAKPFPAIGSLAERKSHSLAGSRKCWPAGLLPPAFDGPWLSENVRKIILVEGGPDYLAACQIIAAQDVNVLPVAMLGASQTISDDVLPYFRNRDVTVVSHGDNAGRTAGMRWAKQIQATGAKVKLMAMTTGDLCDAVSQGATNRELELL